MSILVILFPLLLGIVGSLYWGSPETRKGLWGVTACSVVSLILILAIYNLPFFKFLYNEKGLLLLEGLFFALLFSAPFMLLGWVKELLGKFR
jgi:hypothetical protein